MTAEQKKEYTLRISQANKTQLVVILYEMTLLYLEEAKEGIQSGNRPQKIAALHKVRGCINEMIGSLNFDYEPAGSLLELYIYCSKELVHADIHSDIQNIEHVRMVISALKEAYQMIEKQDQSQPLMSHTQTVYAGLTYGNTGLNENVTNTSGNRGFLA